MPRQPYQPGNRCESHFPAHQHDQRLKEQCETSKAPRPVGLNLPNTPVRQPDTRHTNFKVALMLEKVQGPVTLGYGVVSGMHPLHARNGKATSGNKVDAEGQPLVRDVKIGSVDVPRRGNAQGGFKKFRSHLWITEVFKGRASCRRSQLKDRRFGLYGWMHKHAASSHRSAYRSIPGVKGSLRQAAKKHRSPPLSPGLELPPKV